MESDHIHASLYPPFLTPTCLMIPLLFSSSLIFKNRGFFFFGEVEVVAPLEDFIIYVSSGHFHIPV